MKKIFTNKNFIQKVIIAIIIMILFTFSVPNAFLVDGEFTPDGRKLF